MHSKEDIRWPEFYSSLPLQNSLSEIRYEDPIFVRSGFRNHQEESLNQVPLMAGVDPLGPSDAPCMVELSTAHDGLLSLVPISSTGDLKLLGFPSDASNPALHPQPPSLPSPEMLETLNLTSAQPSRCANPPLPPTAKRGFPLLGPTFLGPLRFLSPLPNDIFIDPLLLLSRFEQNSNPLHSSRYVCVLMEPFVRRLHVESKPPLLLVWLRIIVGHLFLDPNNDYALEVRDMNELGIMIQTLWRCDYDVSSGPLCHHLIYL